MNTHTKLYTINEGKQTRWTFWIVGLALIAGLILSVLSWMELCVEHCSANQDWRLFGFPFAIMGILFFSALNILYFLSVKYAYLSRIVEWMITTALGSEIMFILVQKYKIGHWCPVCLSIAFVVAVAAITLFATHLTKRGQTMNTIKQTLTSFGFLIAGFLMAFVGVSKPDLALAAMNDMQDRLAFGTKNSQIEVYFITDWFCTSCRSIEGLIQKTYPKIESKCAFYFVDYPIHKNSLNFVPYNIAFQINDKPQYFSARNAMTALAKENESPTDEDIIAMSKKYGLHFKELSFVDVKTGMEYFDKIVGQYDLKATPTMIITNTKTHKTTKLEGTDEITEAKVIKAIDSLKH